MNTDIIDYEIPGLAEKNQGYTMAEAIEEAKRCLHCKNPSCIPGCPVEHQIPDWISLLAKGNIGDAMDLLTLKSTLPSICARVCPHETQCEGHCILNKKGKPIHIGKLERFISDFSNEYLLKKERRRVKNRGKVAIIGAGPAGLTVAGDLSKEGFDVTVFDRYARPGGVLVYGIPEYRLPNYVVQKEVDKIAASGVTFRENCVIGKDLSLNDILAEGFDAVFIGSGTSVAQTLGVEGEDMDGVMLSPKFLHEVSQYVNGEIERDAVSVSVGENVAIVGGGNVAMDTARTALRIGAKSVTVFYRKRQENMPALDFEYNEAVEDGVQFVWESVVKEIIGEEVDGKKHLKELLIASPDGEKRVPMDKLILAIGSKPAHRIIAGIADIETDAKGFLITSEKPYGMTTRKGIFAAGDVVHTPKTVVLAMREAKRTAQGIMEYVDQLKEQEKQA